MAAVAGSSGTAVGDLCIVACAEILCTTGLADVGVLSVADDARVSPASCAGTNPSAHAFARYSS